MFCLVSKSYEILLHNVIISSINTYISLSVKWDRGLEIRFVHAIFLSDCEVRWAKFEIVSFVSLLWSCHIEISRHFIYAIDNIYVPRRNELLVPITLFGNTCLLFSNLSEQICLNIKLKEILSGILYLAEP